MKISKSNKRKITLGAAAAMMVVVTLSGTFAWSKYNDERINRFKTKGTDGSVTIVENFKEVPSWPAGTDQIKEVSVTNTGEQAVFVRLSFEEVLEMYTSGAKQIEKTTPVVPGPTVYPVAFSKDVVAGWTEYSGTNVTNSVPGLVLAAEESISQGLVTGKYTVYYEYTDAGETKYQKVEAKVDPAASNVTPNDPANTYTITDVTYFEYEGREQKGFDWADNTNSLFVAPNNVGDRYGVAFDYTAITTPAVTSPSTTLNPLAVPSAKASVLADYDVKDEAGNPAGQKIKINYNVAAMTTTPATDANKWFYDEASGFFYFIGALEGGKSTDKLMNSLSLDGSAGDAYTNIQYDLNVELEAIAGIKAALEEEWGFTTADEMYKILSAYAQF